MKNAPADKRLQIANTYKEVLNNHFNVLSGMGNNETTHWKMAQALLAAPCPIELDNDEPSSSGL